MWGLRYTTVPWRGAALESWEPPRRPTKTQETSGHPRPSGPLWNPQEKPRSLRKPNAPRKPRTTKECPRHLRNPKALGKHRNHLENLRNIQNYRAHGCPGGRPRASQARGPGSKLGPKRLRRSGWKVRQPDATNSGSKMNLQGLLGRLGPFLARLGVLSGQYGAVLGPRLLATQPAPQRSRGGRGRERVL